MTFKETLKDLRVESKKTCAEVAQVLGVTRSAVTNYENGIRCINVYQVKPLAKLFNVTEAEVIDAQINSCQFYLLNNPR